MKEYKYKVMTEATIKEIQELWDNGHAEALAAYGWECANAGVEGYKRGYAIGRATVLVGVGLGMAVTGYAVYKIRERRVLKQKIVEFKEYVEVIDEALNT